MTEYEVIRSVLRRVAHRFSSTDFPPCRRSTCPPAFQRILCMVVSSFRSFRILPVCLPITKALSAAAAMILPSTTVCATAMCIPALNGIRIEVIVIIQSAGSGLHWAFYGIHNPVCMSFIVTVLVLAAQQIIIGAGTAGARCICAGDSILITFFVM